MELFGDGEERHERRTFMMLKAESALMSELEIGGAMTELSRFLFSRDEELEDMNRMADSM